MIISENRKPPVEEFRRLMTATDELLNKEAVGRKEYYLKRNGTALEEDVYDALERCAIHTPFEGTLHLVSGASFPDIVVNKFYGVEVKSTNKNHWKSIGSSILESTRNQNVERIYLTFGKLGAPVAFKSRPYEECLSGISVTHYPCYQIDIESSEVPATVKLWSALSSSEKTYFTVQGYALFPEILSRSSSKKYQRYALWLATNCGVINTNIRDQFSAGGQVDILTVNGYFEKMPAVFGKIEKNKDLIVETILTASEITLCEYWGVKAIDEDRIVQWCQIVASGADEKIGFRKAYKLLCGIFGFYK